MKKPLLTSAIAGLVFSSVGAIDAEAGPAWKSKIKAEKCQGVAKAKKNDCGANGHDCAGHAKKDNDPKEWVYLPAGVCEKIAGGVVKK